MFMGKDDNMSLNWEVLLASVQKTGSKKQSKAALLISARSWINVEKSIRYRDKLRKNKKKLCE